MLTIAWETLLPQWLPEALPLGIFVTDTDLVVRSWCSWMERYSGLRAAEIVGRPLLDTFPDLVERGMDHHYRRALAGEAVALAQHEHGYLLALPAPVEGAEFRLMQQRARVSPLIVAGQLVGTISSITDLTARAAQQQRAERSTRLLSELSTALTRSLELRAMLTTLARTLVPSLAEWAIIRLRWDNDEQPVMVMAHANPQHEQLLGELAGSLAPAFEDQAEQGQVALLDQASQPAATRELLAALAVGSSLVAPLREDERVFGQICLGRSQGFPPYTHDDLRVADEVSSRAVAALAQVRLFTAAARSQAMAEEALQLRDTFFSLAAHELRTPLTTLLGRAQLLQKWLGRQAPAEERNLRAVGIVVEQAQRLNQMISALLDVSRIRTGRFSIVPIRVNLSALVGRVADEWELASGAHQLSFEDVDGPLFVRGDELRLEQVLQSILSNALKYSPGGSAIRVTLARDGKEACLAVNDEGIGIPALARGKLFHRFYRAENAEQLGISGLGIGLFVAREILDMHEGRIDVESTEGYGSTFTIRLPLA